MSENAQLCRIEKKLDALNDRLTRLEERQSAVIARLDQKRAKIEDHEARLRGMEVSDAMSRMGIKNVDSKTSGRWAALGASLLVILGAVGAIAANIIGGLFK